MKHRKFYAERVSYWVSALNTLLDFSIFLLVFGMVVLPRLILYDLYHHKIRDSGKSSGALGADSGETC